MTELDLVKLEAEATPGPWRVDSGERDSDTVWLYGGNREFIAETDLARLPDFRLIAALRNALCESREALDE